MKMPANLFIIKTAKYIISVMTAIYSVTQT